MSKSQNNRIPNLIKKNRKIKQFQSQKIKKNKEQGIEIIEYNLRNEFKTYFEFFERVLRFNQDISRAAKGVLKKPIYEALIQEMLSINNEQDSLKEEELRQIFMECKLKCENNNIQMLQLFNSKSQEYRQIVQNI